MKIIIVLVIFLSIITHAEYPDTTLNKIRERQELIDKASEIFDINGEILSSIIYVERTENYTWEDEAMDNILAKGGLNSSIGFCQVKLKTAYFPGKKYSGVLSLSKSPDEIITKLGNDSLNIMYAAAYLRIMVSHWEKGGFPIDHRADILGTLYSTGLFKRDGSERMPNGNPKANWFGEKVFGAIKVVERIREEGKSNCRKDYQFHGNYI